MFGFANGASWSRARASYKPPIASTALSLYRGACANQTMLYLVLICMEGFIPIILICIYKAGALDDIPSIARTAKQPFRLPTLLEPGYNSPPLAIALLAHPHISKRLVVKALWKQLL